MKIRLTLLFTGFYLIVGNLIVPLLTYLALDYEGYAITIVTSKGEQEVLQRTMGSDIPGVRMIPSYLADVFRQAGAALVRPNPQRIVNFAISLLPVLLVSILLAFLIDRSYREIGRKMDGMKAGDYAFVMPRGGAFPELAQKVTLLAEQLRADRDRGTETAEMERKRLEEMLQQAQKLVSTVRGRLEVLEESGVLNSGSHENELLEEACKGICDADELISNYRNGGT